MIGKLLIKLIKCYQRMPFSSHNQCKYIPTCSEYAIEAIEHYGAFKGMIKALWRILKCNPFSKGGIDPLIKDK